MLVSWFNEKEIVIIYGKMNVWGFLKFEYIFLGLVGYLSRLCIGM